ncbi:MAG: rod shape-determining protein [Clostridia bacterium]|nr:rod shape-determining protein [Clostridia bacterium]
MATEKYVIDFDSAQTNIYMLGGGVVLSEPTVSAVAMDDKNQIKAVGEDAWRLIGKTAKNTKIVFPVFEGEIVNEKVAIGTLKAFLGKIKQKGSFSGAHVLFPVPCGVTAEMVEKYKKVAKACGIGKVYFVEAPILSALGQRIPMNDSSPCFIIDMAGGTTNIAAVSLDGVIAGISVNFGGNKISTDIIDYVADTYDLQIGLLTAEKLKNEIGSLDENDSLSAVVNGRDLKTGAPRSISLKAMDIVAPVKSYFDKIAELAQAVLKKLPPEVSAEIRHAGIYVSGISSSIYGLESYYSKKFQMQINVAEYGNSCVALGGGVAIGNTSLLKKLALKTK